MPHILIVVTASIAAPKVIRLIELLKNANFTLSVIATKDSLNFIDVRKISELTGSEVHVDLFSEYESEHMQHIHLTRKVDLVLIYPATADFINKMTAGFADNLALATVLASNKKIFIAPAMNINMWDNKATKDSLRILASRGVGILGPNEGMLACGEVGMGRVFEPLDTFTFISDYFSLSTKIRDKKIIVTAGGTIEKIDPVRYISNFSSGKQGVSIATYFQDLGAKVVLIKGKTDCYIRQGLEVIEVESALEMHEAVFANLPAFMVVAAAAVADYRPVETSKTKIKKNEDNLSIELCKNPDILFDLGNGKQRPEYLVGFAAESDNLEKHAMEKLKKKNCDVVIANDISEGKIFAADKTSISLFSRGSRKASYDNVEKRDVAALLLKFLFC